MRRPRIDPVVWRPPPRSERSRKQHSHGQFPSVRLVPLDGASAPEDVVVGEDGAVYTGVHGGRILRIVPEADAVEIVGNTGGRPLGLELLADGRLLVCDSHRGLLRLDPKSGEIDVLVEAVGGRRLRFCSNAAAAGDGSIYFSESSSRFGFEHYRADLLEARGSGRLFRLEPDGGVTVLLEGLRFANGVALSADGSAVIVAETGAYRLRRLWLSGPAAGRDEIFAAGLPGFPDNISRSPGGHLWVAIASARDPRLDLLHRTPPWLRRTLWALPERLQPTVRRTAWAIALDEDGEIVRDLQSSDVPYGFVTGVAEHRGRLHLASVEEAAIAILDLAGLDR